MLLNCHVGLAQTVCSLYPLWIMNWGNETRKYCQGYWQSKCRMHACFGRQASCCQRQYKAQVKAFRSKCLLICKQRTQMWSVPGAWPCQSHIGCVVPWGGWCHCWIPDTKRAELPVIFNTFVCFLFRVTEMRSPGQGSLWLTFKGWLQGRLNNNSSGTGKGYWH